MGSRFIRQEYVVHTVPASPLACHKTQTVSEIEEPGFKRGLTRLWLAWAVTGLLGAPGMRPTHAGDRGTLPARDPKADLIDPGHARRQRLLGFHPCGACMSRIDEPGQATAASALGRCAP